MMKNLFIVLFMLAGFGAHASCISEAEAKVKLADYIADPANSIEEFVDAGALLHDLKWFETHYHGQHVFSYMYGEGGGWTHGTVFANVECDGEVRIIVSVDHD